MNLISETLEQMLVVINLKVVFELLGSEFLRIAACTLAL